MRFVLPDRNGTKSRSHRHKPVFTWIYWGRCSKTIRPGVTGERRREEHGMQVIVVRSPKCLAGLLRVLFKMKKEG